MRTRPRPLLFALHSVQATKGLLRGVVMRLSFIAAAGLLTVGIVNTASAADLGVAPRRRPAPVVAPAPLYSSWTGFYIGGNIGGGWSHTTFSGTTTGTVSGFPFPEEFFSASSNGRGIVGGGQLGFNYEFAPRWVTGVEADIDAAHITGSETHCSANALGATTSCATTSGKIDDFGTVRGRLGYAFFDNFLLYGTGGFAWARDLSTDTPTCNGAACPELRVRLHSIAVRVHRHLRAGPLVVVSNGASFRTGQHELNTCIFNSTIYQLPATSPGR